MTDDMIIYFPNQNVKCLILSNLEFFHCHGLDSVNYFAFEVTNTFTFFT